MRPPNLLAMTGSLPSLLFWMKSMMTAFWFGPIPLSRTSESTAGMIRRFAATISAERWSDALKNLLAFGARGIRINLALQVTEC